MILTYLVVPMCVPVFSPDVRPPVVRALGPLGPYGPHEGRVAPMSLMGPLGSRELPKQLYGPPGPIRPSGKLIKSATIIWVPSLPSYGLCQLLSASSFSLACPQTIHGCMPSGVMAGLDTIKSIQRSGLVRLFLLLLRRELVTACNPHMDR